MKKTTAELTLIIIVALWGLSFSLTKPLLSKLGVFNFLAYRFVIGGIVLLALLMMTGRLKISKSLLKSGVISGVLLFFAFYGHIEGLKHTTVAKNAFIVGGSVVFIPVIMLLLYKKKSDRLTLVQSSVAIFGLGLITLANVSGFNRGDLITLIGTILYALFTIYVEKSVKQHNTESFTAVQLCTVGILSTMATFAFETPVFNFTPNEWFSLIFMALVLTGFFYFMLNYIQSILSASNVTLIFTFEPFFATLFGWMFLREAITLNIVVGGVLIISSVLLPYYMNWLSKRRLYESRV